MRIAILDDDPRQSELAGKILGTTGHACHPFASGRDMLQQLRREDYDMLILDWQMTDRSSPAVLCWAREKMPPKLPVLITIGSAG